MAEKEIKKVETPKTEVQPETVSKEMFDNLYTQALALEARYKRLFELYNNLLETYLAGK
jgi:hypothetical protein